MLTLDDIADIKIWCTQNTWPDERGDNKIIMEELLEFLISEANDRCECPEWEGHDGQCDRFGPYANLECECH